MQGCFYVGEAGHLKLMTLTLAEDGQVGSDGFSTVTSEIAFRP